MPLLAFIVWKRLQIGTELLHIITNTGDGLFRFVNIDDLKRFWTPKRGVLLNFSQFLAAAHISTVNCNEMAVDSLDQDNLRTQFSALNADFSCPSSDPLGSRRPAQVCVKDGYPPPLKVVFLPLAGVAWKWLQLIIRSNSDKLFSGVNIDYLEWPWTPE